MYWERIPTGTGEREAKRVMNIMPMCDLQRWGAASRRLIALKLRLGEAEALDHRNLPRSSSESNAYCPPPRISSYADI